MHIGGCLNTDGDFDGVTYDFNWPGSISNPTADALLHPTSMMCTSPLTTGALTSTDGVRAEIQSRTSRTTRHSDVAVFCQRHILNRACSPYPGPAA